MEPTKLDALARTLSTTDLAPSRRGLLSGLAGGVAGLAGLSLLDDADAKKKKGKGKKKKCSKKKRKAGKCGGSGGGGGPTPYDGPVFGINGRSIVDTNGNTLLIRGVNKMSVFDDNDRHGDGYFPEIAKSGANSVRIVWQQDTDRSFADLDAVITNCRNNGMLPMLELHDATGRLDLVPGLVNHWTSPGMLEVIFKHSAYLLVNIANEAGDENTTTQQWVNTYTSAVQQMRGAGIRTPLVIDAPEYGKSSDKMVAGLGDLLAVDANLAFSFHPYWGINEGADSAFISAKFKAAYETGACVIVGEFSKWGAYAGEGKSICQGDGLCDYMSIMGTANTRKFPWYAWEWGPGNEYGDPGCAAMDMTTDGTFASRKGDWVTPVIQNLAGAPKIF